MERLRITVIAGAAKLPATWFWRGVGAHSRPIALDHGFCSLGGSCPRVRHAASMMERANLPLQRGLMAASRH